MVLPSRPSVDPRDTVPDRLPTAASISAPKPTNNPTAPILALTHHVQAQCIQARHLFSQTALCLSPEQRQWVQTTIADTESTVREILRLTESFRVEETVRHGRVGVMSQVRWLLCDSRKAREKRERLVLCHGSLMGALTHLQHLHHKHGGETQPGLSGLGAATSMSTGWSLERGPVDSPVSTTVMGSAYRSGCQLGPGTHGELSRSGSPPWDLAMQFQDAGMEVVVSEDDSRSGTICTKSPIPVPPADDSLVKLPLQELKRPYSIFKNESVVS